MNEYTEAMKAAGKADKIGFIKLEGYMVAKLFTQALEKVDGESTRQKWLPAVADTGTFDLGGTIIEFGLNDHRGMDQVSLSRVFGGKAVPAMADRSVATAEEQELVCVGCAVSAHTDGGSANGRYRTRTYDLTGVIRAL